MTHYLLNAFSLSMLSFTETVLRDTVVSEEAVAHRLRVWGFQSGVGHADTAALFSGCLKVPVEVNRVSVTLQPGDIAIVGQYSGPRLPEGATQLPEGAKLVWHAVEIVDLAELSRVATNPLRGDVEKPPMWQPETDNRLRNVVARAVRSGFTAAASRLKTRALAQLEDFRAGGQRIFSEEEIAEIQSSLEEGRVFEAMLVAYNRGVADGYNSTR